MASGNKVTEQAIKDISTAWENEAAEVLFGGMTLAQYKTKVKPSADTRAEVDRLEKLLTAAINRREEADKASKITNQLVVNGVKGDPNFGEDSDLYEAMGYVRKSERKSGLSRGKKAAETPPK